MAKFKQSIITSIIALLALTPNAVNALQAHLYPQQNGLCSSFKDYNQGGYDYICGVRTGSIQAEDAIFRVAIYTGIPNEPIPTENTRPENWEYYEWRGFTNLHIDENGCLRPVDNSEAGVFITSNNCPPALYPTSKLDAPDIPNPYYLLQKLRENQPSGKKQSFLPELNNAPFVSSADTGIINDKIVADGAAFWGGDTGSFRPVIADQVAAAPAEDNTLVEWGASNLRRKFKQRRTSVEKGMT